MSDTFCALPWMHLLITSYGGAQVCCLARDMLKEHGRQVSLYTATLDDVWNCDSLRRIRRNMLNGSPSPECQLCYDNEANKIRSERIEESRHWETQEGFTIDVARQHTDGDGRTTIPRPRYYQLLVSNACNLSCRMCNSEASSRVEHDAIHHAWAPGHNAGVSPRWKGDRAVIGPGHHIGVRAYGLRPCPDSAEYQIIDRAIFDIPVLPATDPPVAIEYVFAADSAFPLDLSLSLNGEQTFQGRVEAGDGPLCLPVPAHLLSAAPTLRAELSVAASGPALLRRTTLIRAEAQARSGEYVVSRFSDKTKTLFEQDSFLFGELLSRPQDLRRLYVTGGEPLYSKALLRMVCYLNDTGHSGAISAHFTTNGTVMSETLAEQLRHFNVVRMGVSIDDQGAAIEYIRNGTKWSDVVANIGKLRAIPNIELHAIPAVQIMNMLSLADTLRFCDGIDLPFGMNLVYYPDFLNVLAAPWPVRHAAADRLQAYVDNDCRADQRETVLSLVHHLRHGEDMCTPERMRMLMLFTNDLDDSRTQSFAATFPELLRLIEEGGYPWTDERRFSRRETVGP
ncbi:MAG: SPASM domain-containing protein [Magnetospirillum gryphiswaldense]|nr:SPASM domain-containing protein [Magnetospirillum gryphiswaldense]